MTEYTSFEYRKIVVDFDDLTELNRLGLDGWRVLQTLPTYFGSAMVLLERSMKILPLFEDIKAEQK